MNGGSRVSCRLHRLVANGGRTISRSLAAAICAGWFATVVSAACAVPPTSDDPVDFNRQIRPILAGNCFVCHGPDAESRAADLRLDDRDLAVERQAIVPGDPDASLLVQRILAADPGERMPPPESHKELTTEQRELLVRWIAEGAKFAGHWAWQPPALPGLPEVQQPSWPRGPLDQFVLARLERAGLAPAPEAPLEHLARRAAFDITGLPPTPEQVRELLADPAPDRYERYVDRLLAQPQWGEHRGRLWLDYARYADTHGIHFDNFREVWAYRDWVISAFNRNLPFDQFTVEQLAGDLLPEPSMDQLIATGFNRCNITTNEGGVIEEEYNVLYTRDRVETVAQVWLGLTAGCAVCHDHKYDPLSQREFYRLAAIFHNTTQPVMDGNIKDTPPVIRVPAHAERQRWEEVAVEIGEASRRLEAARAAGREQFSAWMGDQRRVAEFLAEPVIAAAEQWLHLPLEDGRTEGLTAAIAGELRRIGTPASNEWKDGWTGDRSWVVRKENSPALADVGDPEWDQPFSVAVWVRPASGGQSGAIVSRMTDGNGYRGWDLWLMNGRPGMHLIHHWPGNALKVVARQALPAGKWSHVAMSYDGSGKASGVRIWVNGQMTGIETEADALNGTSRTTTPLRVGGRDGGSWIEGAALNDLRLVGRALGQDEPLRIMTRSRLRWLLPRFEQLEEGERELAATLWMDQAAGPWRDAAVQLARLEEEREGIAARGTVAHIVQERSTPPRAWVLHRGEYTQRREEVGPETPAFLPPWREDLPRNRLGFARWLLEPDHPLTARVTVNRFWQEVFGQGLVASAGDFGTAGQIPSHPELLDWLAVRFREQGWDVKWLFREMLTSATYRQAAVTTPEKLERDPDNRLLSRGPRFRLDAEAIRDLALAASGLLSPRIGGPSVRPYQPPGVWEAVAMPESNTREYVRDTGEGLYRRSMYTFWKRAAPPASMDVFNAPSRETCVVRRERTNTPLQALVVLNDPQFVEAARGLATRLLQAGWVGEDAVDRRFEELGQRVLARSFRPDETAILRGSLEQLRAQFSAATDSARQLLGVGDHPVPDDVDPVELAAWTMLVSEVLNLDEAICK